MKTMRKIDMLAESLVMMAAAPGQNAEQQRRSRLNKQILLPIVEAIQAQDLDSAADAMATVAKAMALFMLADPDKAGAALLEDAKRHVRLWNSLGM